MKTRLIIPPIIAGVIFLTACTTLKRYRSVKDSGTNDTLVDIDLFGSSLFKAKPEKSSKSLWDLSVDAQSQFIKILNSRYPDNEMFISSLNNEYIKGQDEALQDDYTDKDLKLIFSVSKKRGYLKNSTFSGIKLSPADRIEYLRISLEIPEETNLRFTGWNIYTTEYGSVDIADVSFNRSLDLGASASLSKGKASAGGASSVDGNSSISLKENQAVKYRYLKLNGRISEKKIEMEEEGTRDIDLTGNILADVSLEFEKFPEVLTLISGIKDSTGKFNDPGRLILHYSDFVVPYHINAEDTIKAIIRMDFIYRNVGGGKRTFQEWDDRAKYFSGCVEKTFPLFTRSDYLPQIYCIGYDCNQRELVKIKDSADRLYALKFRTYKEASGFYEWLRYYISKKENQRKTVHIGGDTLIFKNADLTGEQIDGNSCFKVMSYY